MALERFLAKHVEMNYHARLVLFLRGQNVITQLEADEYLNPAAGGPGAGGLAQPNIQARHTVRRGMVVHASILGVLALMLGLIHVAPIGDANSVSPTMLEAGKRGYLRVDAYPWAKVNIDGRDVGVTPLDQPIELSEGKHRVVLVHDWYMPVERSIEVATGDRDSASSLRVDFEIEGTLLPGKEKPEVRDDAPDEPPTIEIPMPEPTPEPTIDETDDEAATQPAPEQPRKKPAKKKRSTKRPTRRGR
jgi:hypothetical protein